MMKKFLKLILLHVLLALAASPSHAAKPMMEYPSIPDSLVEIQDRYDYYVSHFWDEAQLERGISSPEDFTVTFIDFISPARFAAADTVYSAVSRLMARLANRPQDMLLVGKIAEEMLYSDSAAVRSDDIYLAVLKPILRNSLIDRSLKARMQNHFITLNNTRAGRPIAVFPVYDRQGNPTVFTPDSVAATLLMLSDPDCIDCSMARMRLRGNVQLNRLIESGDIKVAVICEWEPGEDWTRATAQYPENWEMFTNPEIDTFIDMRGGFPSFYLLGPNGIIIAKNLSTNEIVAVIEEAGRIAAPTPTPTPATEQSTTD